MKYLRFLRNLDLKLLRTILLCLQVLWKPIKRWIKWYSGLSVQSKCDFITTIGLGFIAVTIFYLSFVMYVKL